LPAGHLLIINGNGKNGNGNGTKQVSISAFEKENGNGTNGKENGTEINAKENSFETLNDSALQNSSCACVEKVNLFEAVEKKVLGKKVLSNENGSNFGSSAEFGTGASALELNANNSNLTSSHFSVPKFEIKKFSESKNIAHCFFEWIYFAHAASKLDGRLVYSVRRNLGKELAKMETQKIDGTCVVVAVPDSSTPCGQGFAEALNIPMQEGLIRNRYLGRTFIEGRNRAEKVRDKFAIIKEVFEGKKVFLVEDSIVRGTTLKNMVEFIKKNGSPKEIHVRVSCPPIKFPCFYGIDMSTKKELIAHQKTLDEIRKDLDVDSLVYQTEKGLLNALEIPKENLCMACLNGLYPTKAGKDNEKLDTKNCKN
jgi:glutamine phosphoribosylpyrophosphate amidotransferase